jgi:hypothetical protein
VFLVFRKKKLCGLCVLSGSIPFFCLGGYGDFYDSWAIREGNPIWGRV